MSIGKKLWILMLLGLFIGIPGVSLSKEPKQLEILSVGFRGGLNLVPGGIPPGEDEDFQLFDVMTIVGFPGSWEWPSGWEVRYRWYASAGVIKSSGDKGFISTFGPGLAMTKWDWNVTLDLGTGVVYVSDETFGSQDFGGPAQILGHGGINYHFSKHIMGGWRFQHFSDAGLYGENRGVDLHILEVHYRF